MTPDVVGALGCALSFIVGWWLRRASAVAEIRVMQAAVDRALKGEQEWSQLAVERRAVIEVLEARAVADAAIIEELRAQVEVGGPSLSLHFRRVRVSEAILQQIAPLVQEEARQAARQEFAGELMMAQDQRLKLEEALRSVRARLEASQ